MEDLIPSGLNPYCLYLHLGQCNSHLNHCVTLQTQWLSTRSNSIPQMITGSVCRHVGCYNWSEAWAPSGKTPAIFQNAKSSTLTKNYLAQHVNSAEVDKSYNWSTSLQSCFPPSKRNNLLLKMKSYFKVIFQM